MRRARGADGAGSGLTVSPAFDTLAGLMHTSPRPNNTYLPNTHLLGLLLL
jgi:hypothetical protein